MLFWHCCTCNSTLRWRSSAVGSRGTIDLLLHPCCRNLLPLKRRLPRKFIDLCVANKRLGRQMGRELTGRQSRTALMSLCILPSENKKNSLHVEQTLDKWCEDHFALYWPQPTPSESKDTLTRKGPGRPAVSSSIRTLWRKHRKYTGGGGVSVPSWNEQMEPGNFQRLQGWLPDGHDARWQAGSGESRHCQGKGRDHHLSPARVNLHLMQAMGVEKMGVAGEDISEHFGGKTTFCSQCKTRYYWGNQKI